MDVRVWPPPSRISWPKPLFREGQLVLIGDTVYRIQQIAERFGDFQVTFEYVGSREDA